MTKTSGFGPKNTVALFGWLRAVHRLAQLNGGLWELKGLGTFRVDGNTLSVTFDPPNDQLHEIFTETNTRPTIEPPLPGDPRLEEPNC